jgi:hypothetical protein
MEAVALDCWADTILPGEGTRWPAASLAVSDLTHVVAELSLTDALWLHDLARRLVSNPRGTRVAIAEHAERDMPEPFARSVQALYRHYYTSDIVLRVVEALANASPREPSRTFDPTLLDRVVGRNAGRRRL